MHHEHEYNAIRNSAALIDISPLFKYRIAGSGRHPLVTVHFARHQQSRDRSSDLLLLV